MKNNCLGFPKEKILKLIRQVGRLYLVCFANKSNRKVNFKSLEHHFRFRIEDIMNRNNLKMYLKDTISSNVPMNECKSSLKLEAEDIQADKLLK